MLVRCIHIHRQLYYNVMFHLPVNDALWNSLDLCFAHSTGLSIDLSQLLTELSESNRVGIVRKFNDQLGSWQATKLLLCSHFVG